MHPERNRVPALEQNILKYRAIEMILVLFHAEDLREFIVGCVRSTTRIRKSRASNHRNENERVLRVKKARWIMRLTFLYWTAH
jgi:hypothetical protein